MKRLLAISIVGILTIGTMSMTTNATAGQPAGPCTGYGVKRSTPVNVRRARMTALIHCAFRWGGIPSQIPEAVYVGDRESSLYPWAWNRSSDCRGLFQHMGRYWGSRARALLKRWWFPNTWPNVSAFNPRANVLVTVKMVRVGGWSPWSTA